MKRGEQQQQQREVSEKVRTTAEGAAMGGPGHRLSQKNQEAVGIEEERIDESNQNRVTLAA